MKENEQKGKTLFEKVLERFQQLINQFNQKLSPPQVIMWTKVTNPTTWWMKLTIPTMWWMKVTISTLIYLYNYIMCAEIAYGYSF